VTGSGRKRARRAPRATVLLFAALLGVSGFDGVYLDIIGGYEYWEDRFN